VQGVTILSVDVVMSFAMPVVKEEGFVPVEILMGISGSRMESLGVRDAVR